MKKFLFWTPRILTVLYALFLALFAFDIFDGTSGFWNIVFGLMIHLIPTVIILAILALSWRRGWIGALLFPAFGMWYIVIGWGRQHWSVFVIITGPLFLAGILYAIDWFSQRKTILERL
jgi:hypothetical protein